MQGYEYGWRQNIESTGMQPMGMQPMNMQPMGMQPMNMQPMGMQPMNMQPTGMQPMGMQNQYNPMVTMPEQELENMYPNVYNIVNPVVENHCYQMDMKYGAMYCPTKEQVEAETEQIVKEVEHDVQAAVDKDTAAAERQLGFGGRRLLRDLAGILLIRSLIGRRRPYCYFPGYFYGSPFFYGGY